MGKQGPRRCEACGAKCGSRRRRDRALLCPRCAGDGKPSNVVTVDFRSKRRTRYPVTGWVPEIGGRW